MNKGKIIILSKPQWLIELLKSGRLDKNYSTPENLLIISHKKPSKSLRLKHTKLKNIEKRFDKINYVFNPHTAQIEVKK